MDPFLLVFISAALFGASAPAAKALVSAFSPFQLAGLLYLGAAIGTLPVLVKSKEKAFLVVEKSSRYKLLGALVCGALAAPAYMFALTKASAATVSMFLCLETPFTAILAALLFREHLGKFGVLGVVGTTMAAVLLSYGQGSAALLAVLAASAACFLWSVDNNLTAVIDGITPTQVTFWKGLVAGSINLALGCLLQPFHPALGQIACAIIIGALCYGVSITLYISAAQKIGATRAQMIFASAPFWGVVISAFWLSEQLTRVQGVAAAILALSVNFLMRDRHSHLHSHQALSHTHEHAHDDGHHEHVHEDNSNAESHTHWHEHQPLEHRHPHWPDLHHRHTH